VRGARWVGLFGLLAVVGCEQWCKNPCKPGAVSCPGAATICSDLQNDRLHCGACDRRCGEQETCRAGQCVPCTITCTPPATRNLDTCGCDCPKAQPRCGGSCCPPEFCCDGRECCGGPQQCCKGTCCPSLTYCCQLQEGGLGSCSDTAGNCNCERICTGGDVCCGVGCCPPEFPTCCGTKCCRSGWRCLSPGVCDDGPGPLSTSNSNNALRPTSVPVKVPGGAR
jgi:hypothetical protein